MPEPSQTTVRPFEVACHGFWTVWIKTADAELAEARSNTDASMSRPTHENLVNGPHTLENGILKFQTKGSLLGSDAARAMRAGRSLTVCVHTPTGLREITGTVLSAVLLRGTPPTEWEVTVKVLIDRRAKTT